MDKKQHYVAEPTEEFKEMTCCIIGSIIATIVLGIVGFFIGKYNPSLLSKLNDLFNWL